MYDLMHDVWRWLLRLNINEGLYDYFSHYNSQESPSALLHVIKSAAFSERGHISCKLNEKQNRTLRNGLII